jgi:serine/threonine protein kinase
MTKRTAPARKFPGDYRIIDEVASSATSRIFLGETISLPHQPVVIKYFYTTHLNAQQEDDFRQETHFLQQLRHPSILKLIEAETDKGGVPYMVMDYAPNSSLDKSMHYQAHLPWPQKKAQSIILQIGQALQYAHQHNIIHCNLKPQNILFDAHGRALVADFHLVSLPESLQVTASTTYMAPEELLGEINKECDQYALGCIAYEMFTGHTPYQASSLYYPGNRQRQPTLVAPTLLNRSLSADIERAILKALAPEPGQRHRDIQTFLNILGSAVSNGAGDEAEVIKVINTPGIEVRSRTTPYAIVTPQLIADVAALASYERTNQQRNTLAREKTPIFKQKKIVIALTCILVFACIISGLGLYIFMITQSKPQVEPTPGTIKTNQFIITSSQPIAPTPFIIKQATTIQASISSATITQPSPTPSPIAASTAQPSPTDITMPSATMTPIGGSAAPSLIPRDGNVDHQSHHQQRQSSGRAR